MAFRELTAMKADAMAQASGVEQHDKYALGLEAQRVDRSVWAAMGVRKSALNYSKRQRY
jgi:hypothetical protein